MKFAIVLLITVGTSVLSGCGLGQNTAATSKKPVGVSANGGDPGINSPMQTSGASSSSAPYQVAIAGVGYTMVGVDVKVNSVLKVQFAPGRQNQATQSSGNYDQYAHLGVYIGTASSAEPTEMLSNGFLEAATKSHTIDLSKTFHNTCGTDPNCRQTVRIYVSKPNSDVKWLPYANYMPFYYTVQPDGVPWNGTLYVQTDDTSAL